MPKSYNVVIRHAVMHIEKVHPEPPPPLLIYAWNKVVF